MKIGVAVESGQGLKIVNIWWCSAVTTVTAFKAMPVEKLNNLQLLVNQLRLACKPDREYSELSG